MTQKPTLEELQNRIASDVKHFGGSLPERFAIAWSGYLAALIEWGLLEVEDHRRALELLPSIPDDPSTAILLGREDTEE